MSAPWGVLILALWFVVVVLAVILLGLIRRVAPLLVEGQTQHAALEPQGLAIGAEVPFFRARDDLDRIVEPGELIADGGLFVFVAPGCPPCDELLLQLAQSVEPIASILYLILDGSSNTDPRIDSARVHVLQEIDHSMTRAFGNSAAPHAFAVNREGRVVARDIVNTPRDLARLAASIHKDERDEVSANLLHPAGGSALVREGV
jgi:thiol-disulfide isomerase/thioredoxin